MTTVYVSEENLKSLVHHKLHTAGHVAWLMW